MRGVCGLRISILIDDLGFVLTKDIIRDGKVVAYSMTPTAEELEACYQTAKSKVSDAAKSIVIGTEINLDDKIGDLIEKNTRLLIADRNHRPGAWPKADSYDSK